MTHRPIPEALKRQSGTTQRRPPPAEAPGLARTSDSTGPERRETGHSPQSQESDLSGAETPAAPVHIRLYLAVPDKRFLAVLKQKARIFASSRSDASVSLYAFHAPDLPNLPTDDLQLLGTLTEFGDVEGVEIITLSPETAP